MVEDLCVVGTLRQGVQPCTSGALCVAPTEVEVGESASQRARVRTHLQQTFTEGHTLLVPAGTNVWVEGAAEFGGGITHLISHCPALPVMSLTFAAAYREE